MIKTEKNIDGIEQKRIEQAFSKIGSKIADATELSRRAKEITTNSEWMLTAAQQEIETLYVSLNWQKKWNGDFVIKESKKIFLHGQFECWKINNSFLL